MISLIYVDFFRTCTRNSSPLVTSLEQKHHPSFASALVSQDVGLYFMDGSHRRAQTLYLQWTYSNMATCPKRNSKFSILQSLGLFGSC